MKRQVPDHAPGSGDQNPGSARTLLGWSDFEIVMVVAQVGQLSRAAEALAISHVTLLRKLAVIESRLKARLFDRVRGHYTATAAGDELITAARAMAPMAREAEMKVIGQDLRPSGHVRITAAGVLVGHALPAVLGQFSSAFPEVTLELLSTRNLVSLTRREADVAFRISDRVPDWLVGRQLAQLDFKIYGLRHEGLKPRLQTHQALAKQKRWIAFESDARELKFDRWLLDQVPDTSVVLRVDSFEHALAMLRAGLGIALLPAFLEHSCPELQPLSAAIPELRTPLWVITHKELSQTMRIKVVMQAIGPALAHAVKVPVGQSPAAKA
jgi:DNA-binding transcriptional LysR family regulator